MMQLTSRSTDVDPTTTPIPVEGRLGEFDVDRDRGWSSLVGLHGGHVSALAVRAVGR